MRAMESMRLEKSYRMWGTDLTRDYTPLEAGLGRFVRLEKPEFIGQRALLEQRARGVPQRFTTIEVHGVVDADPLGNEPLFVPGGAMVGRSTSGYYGHTLRKSLAIGYVKPELAEVGTELEIEILGERKRATVLPDSPYDPENRELRA
jgi:dimethylglycine dehydrogenase